MLTTGTGAMLIHRIGLGFMFIHVVYLSAHPVLPDDKKKTSTAGFPALSEDETSSSRSSEPPEPWEVNQDLIINRYNEGVHGFCRLLSQRVYVSVLAENPLICRLSSSISNRKRKSLADPVSAAEGLASNFTAFK